MISNTLSSALSRIVRCATLAAAISVAACGGGGSGNSVVDTPGQALYTSASPSVSLAQGATAAYSVGGGGSGAKFTAYSASSSDANVAKVVIGGTKFTITGVGGGTAAVTVSDSSGNSVTINVSVPMVGANKLYVNAPAAVTLATGMTAQYDIGGGAAPFSAVSSNPGVANAITAGRSLTVTGTNAGTANVVVYDANGVSVQVGVTIGSGSSGSAVALYSTAPSSINMAKGSQATYTIGGGTAPYTVTSNSVAQATASITGNKMTVSAVAGGQANISVVDAAGVQLTVAVTVTQDPAYPLHTTAPAILAMGANSVSTYAVAGGTAPYSVSSNNAAVATATVDSGSLKITSGAAGVASIFVFDSTGTSLQIALTVGGGVPAPAALFTTAPSAITIAPGTNPAYTINGGTGPYSVSSTNVSVAKATLSAGNILTISGLANGLAQIVVVDAKGASVQVATTVTNGNATADLYTTAPAAIVLAPSNSSTYQIGGGTGPYTVASSNAGVATAEITGGNSLTIRGLVAGGTQIVVLDSLGKRVQINVAVNGGVATPLFSTAPSSITLTPSEVETYQLAGGTAPYVATSSNVSVVTVVVDGNAITVKGIATGTAAIVIHDFAGVALTINATVP